MKATMQSRGPKVAIATTRDKTAQWALVKSLDFK